MNQEMFAPDTCTPLDEETRIMLDKLNHFRALADSSSIGPRKFMAGPQNKACRLEREYVRLLQDRGPKHAFAEELDSIQIASARKKESNIIAACLEFEIGMIREKMRKIFLDPEKTPGEKLLKEIIGSRLPLFGNAKEKLTPYLAGLLARFPQIIDYLPDKPLIGLAKMYEQSFNALAERMTPRIKAATEKVQHELIEAARQKRIPVGVERVEEILAETPVNFSDPMLQYCERSNNVGTFKAETGSITADMDLSEKDLEQVIMHEAVHALSGKTYKVDTEAGKVKSVRQGFRYVTTDGYDLIRTLRFNWLNEAFTEIVAGNLCGIKANDPEYKQYYYLEKELFYLIFKDMPDIGCLARAYFEDYDEKKAATGQNLPAWREMQSYLKRRYGSYFLLNLDDFVRLNEPDGAKEAVQEFKKQGEKFPAYLASYRRKFGF